MNNMTRKEFMGALAAAGAMAGCVGPQGASGGGKRWRRGMLHMHTHWSDGHALPEQAVAAYKDAGYDFVAITDHNRFQDDPDRWIAVGDGTEKGWPPKVVHPARLRTYVERFGNGRVRERDGKTEIHLATYRELKKMFDEKGRFLLLPGVELTTDAKATGQTFAMHMNVIGTDDIIERAKKAPLIEKLANHTVASAIRESREMSEALAAKRVAKRGKKRSAQPVICMVNHPHWLYFDVYAQDFIDNPEIRYFEICNNGAVRPAPEGLDGEWYNDNLWDAVLAYRASHGQQPLYGFGSDDKHFYPGTGLDKPPMFGDGYVMVRSEELSWKSLYDAMRRGDFYASSELDLEDVTFDRATMTLSVSVPAMAGVASKIRFIVTKKGAPLDPVRRVEIPAAKEHMNRVRSVPVYDGRVGETVKLVDGAPGAPLKASYTLADDDLYVRARVETDAPTQILPLNCMHPSHRTAWTQPYSREW